MSWSPDGKYLASGGNDNVVCVWNSSAGECFAGQTPHLTLTEHQVNRSTKKKSGCFELFLLGSKDVMKSKMYKIDLEVIFLILSKNAFIN